MTPKQREAAKELIVLTHVAEAAVPDIDNYQRFIAVHQVQRAPNDIKGGVAGIDKAARGYLTKIAEGEANFEQIFKIDTGEFVIARNRGKKQLKEILYKPDVTAKKDGVQQLGKDLDFMSDNSDARARSNSEVKEDI